jgi:hypothetical protein
VNIASANSAAKNQATLISGRKLGGPFGGVPGSAALTWAVLLTVSVAVAGEELVTFNEDGEIVQLKLVCGVTQFRLTAPANPSSGPTLIVEVADCPGAEIFILNGFADREKSETFRVVATEAEAA